MRAALLAAVAGLSVAVSALAQAQSTPAPIQDNDASLDGAVRSRDASPPADARGSAGPESEPAGGTVTGSPAAPADSLETETGLGTLMDSDESEASRSRLPERR